MRFNYKAYDELYPRQPEPEEIETVVETFTPTTDEITDETEPADETEPQPEEVK